MRRKSVLERIDGDSVHRELVGRAEDTDGNFLYVRVSAPQQAVGGTPLCERGTYPTVRDEDFGERA